MNKQQKGKKLQHKINKDLLSYNKVKLVSWFDNVKILSSQDALDLAEENELDLVCISTAQDLPIVKIVDYNKFLYDSEKNKKKQQKIELKEVQLSVNISENDLMVKVKKAIQIIQKGDKVKCTLMMKGREKYNPERGQLMMLKFVDSCMEYAVPEFVPKIEGNKWITILKKK